MPTPVPGCRGCAARQRVITLAKAVDEPDAIAAARLLLALHLNEVHGQNWDV
ncbi:hypothetical protein [Streptomyces sp. I05A-00742]|uniref:hypothetical protein n=1 Tax=Streptomyces sp. I05A-00742 TaxID=2732853 RepID=UPI00148850B0|nr:hypothetical protein [Streptomyces sp. I05A-00742]